MRDYYNSYYMWRTSDHRFIHISSLETDHLAGIIDFIRWDAAKELGFTQVSPGAFDISKFNGIQIGRINHLIKAKLLCCANLEREARERSIWDSARNAKTVLKEKIQKEQAIYGGVAGGGKTDIAARHAAGDWPVFSMDTETTGHFASQPKSRPVGDGLQATERLGTTSEVRRHHEIAAYRRIEERVARLESVNPRLAGIVEQDSVLRGELDNIKAEIRNKTRACFARISDLEKRLPLCETDPPVPTPEESKKRIRTKKRIKR